MKIETGPMVRWKGGNRAKDFMVDGRNVGFIFAGPGQVFQADPNLYREIGQHLLSTSAKGSVGTVLSELRKKYGGKI